MYQPSDDSYFFAEFLEKYLNNLKNKEIYLLDMGSGSGILAETALKCGIKNVLAADINKESVKHIKNKKIPAIQSNLFKPIGNRQLINSKGDASRLPNKNKVQKSGFGKFDIITFNAPYLPRDKDEPKDSQLETTGGKKGDEVSIKFIAQAKKHLNKDGKIFLLISSLTPLDKINKFEPKIIARKKLWMEELLILEFTP